jgi:SEL1 protein
MARSRAFRTSLVSFPSPVYCSFVGLALTRTRAATKKEWTVSEWLSAFLEAELAGRDDYEMDDYDEHIDGGDGYYDDVDSDILESLVILALSGALAFLLYYRAQRQQRQEAERQRQQQQQQQQQPAADRGMFPNPGDPEFMNWVAGGVGH